MDYLSRPLNRERLAAIQQYAGHTVLDVGCGNGKYVLHLADTHAIHGVDTQVFSSWNTRKESFSVGSAGDLCFRSSSFDTILLFEVLEHLLDPADALVECFRVAKRNIIITVPNCEVPRSMENSGLIYNHWRDRTHVNFWTLVEAVALVEKAGFDVTFSGHINYINPGHLVAHSIGLSGNLALYFAGFFKLITPRRFPLTTIIIANKR